MHRIFTTEVHSISSLRHIFTVLKASIASLWTISNNLMHRGCKIAFWLCLRLLTYSFIPRPDVFSVASSGQKRPFPSSLYFLYNFNFHQHIHFFFLEDWFLSFWISVTIWQTCVWGTQRSARIAMSHRLPQIRQWFRQGSSQDARREPAIRIQ